MDPAVPQGHKHGLVDVSDILYFFCLEKGERGVRGAGRGGGIGFLLKIPAGGGGGCRMGGAEGPGGCLSELWDLGGVGLNIFFRGRNVHQDRVTTLGKSRGPPQNPGEPRTSKRPLQRPQANFLGEPRGGLWFSEGDPLELLECDNFAETIIVYIDAKNGMKSANNDPKNDPKRVRKIFSASHAA